MWWIIAIKPYKWWKMRKRWEVISKKCDIIVVWRCAEKRPPNDIIIILFVFSMVLNPLYISNIEAVLKRLLFCWEK